MIDLYYVILAIFLLVGVIGFIVFIGLAISEMVIDIRKIKEK